MAKTVSTVSSSVVAATAAELVRRVDARVLGDLVSDTGERLSPSALQADLNFLALVRDAWADLESACLEGQRYTSADLAALVANTGAAAGKVYRILAWLVTQYAFERRPDREPANTRAAEQAQEHLRMLADGRRIFSLSETAAAGVAETEVETAAEVESRDLATYQARGYFGRRGSRGAGEGG